MAKPVTNPPARPPHRLALYRAAVQHPLAEVAFLEKAAASYGVDPPTLLREDFAGTAAVAAAFVASDPDRQALAVDTHGPTTRWAQREAERQLGPRAIDLHLVHADVRGCHGPRVEVVCALNFSCFIYHDRSALLAYLRHARRCLRPGGMLVMDLFGGPDSARTRTQRRRVVPDDLGLRAFEYTWEQRSFDAATGRLDCRIHFAGGRGASRWSRRDAFRYDWRRWTPEQWVEALDDAGFRRPSIWCDGPQTPGVFQRDARIAGREAFTAYVTAQRP